MYFYKLKLTRPKIFLKQNLFNFYNHGHGILSVVVIQLTLTVKHVLHF
jgi:hypothetical protein